MEGNPQSTENFFIKADAWVDNDFLGFCLEVSQHKIDNYFKATIKARVKIFIDRYFLSIGYFYAVLSDVLFKVKERIA